MKASRFERLQCTNEDGSEFKYMVTSHLENENPSMTVANLGTEKRLFVIQLYRLYEAVWAKVSPNVILFAFCTRFCARFLRLLFALALCARFLRSLFALAFAQICCSFVLFFCTFLQFHPTFIYN